MTQMTAHFRFLGTLSLAAALANGYANAYEPSICSQIDPEFYEDTSDPFEGMNRAIFKFNSTLDRTIFEPLAKGYSKSASQVFQKGVRNFSNNSKELRNIVASAMTGKFSGAVSSTFRFVVNSTLGVFGILDVAGAGDHGVPYKSYDFGQVFAYWGVNDGPYIVIPFFGPSNLRDMTGSAVDSSQTYVVKRIDNSDVQLSAEVLIAIDTRLSLLTFTEMAKTQPDEYIFIRESYRQNRINLVCKP